MNRLCCLMILGLLVAVPVWAGGGQGQGQGLGQGQGKGQGRQLRPETVVRAQEDGIDLADKSKAPLNKVKLELPLELENKSEEYILAYVAYQEARSSKNSKVLAQLPEYLRMYRKTYGDFLKTMRTSGLVHPLLPKNPVGWYTEKSQEEDPTKPVYWRSPRIKSKVLAVKILVNAGVPAREIHAQVVAQLPLERPIADQDADLSMNVEPFADKGEAESETNHAKSTFHTAKGNPYATKHDIAKAHEKFLAHLQAKLATYLKVSPDDDEKIKELRGEVKKEMSELDEFRGSALLPF